MTGGIADSQLVTGPDDHPHPGLAEDQIGPLVGVLGVHGHVRGTGGQHREDRHVQVVGARRDPDTDAVPEPDVHGGQPPPQVLHLDRQCAVGEQPVAVVERGLVGVRTYGRLEDVDQGAGGGRGTGGETGHVAQRCARLPVQHGEFRAFVQGGHRILESRTRSSGAPVGPQVCLGMFRSGANKPNTLVVG
jgi:hypothetical protein